MLIQRTQHSSRIGAAAAQACLHGDALENADLQAIGILADGIEEELGCLPGKVGLVGGNTLDAAQQAPGLAGAYIDLDIVPQRDGLHYALDIVITVRTLIQHVQGQVQFGKCAFVESCHLIFLPSR